MSYELFKELEEAGFQVKGMPVAAGSAYHFPNLSELIEACGNKFEYLHKTGDAWSAYYDEAGKRNGAMYLPSPEEAVANLWLTLNKHV